VRAFGVPPSAATTNHAHDHRHPVLRLLTAEAVMGDEVLKQSDAWAVYDRWLADERVGYLDEPQGIERRFPGPDSIQGGVAEGLG
jgi:hypothetical protein